MRGLAVQLSVIRDYRVRKEDALMRDDEFVFTCVVAFEAFGLLFSIGFPAENIFLTYFLHLSSSSPSLSNLPNHLTIGNDQSVTLSKSTY